jgi:hypothetical protein
MATDTTALTPVEIDTILAANYIEQSKAWALIKGQVRNIESLKKRLARNSQGEKSFAQIDQANEVLAGYRANLREIENASLPYILEYSRRPWSRYFLVTNANCNTCFPDTQYTWLVDLADCDENAMIEEWGERACTVCFPSAPTNPNYNRPARIDREAREAKAAEKAAKDAAKADKAITDVDGSVLKIDGNPLRTKVAARNELSSAFQSLVFYGNSFDKYAGQIRKLVPALEAAGVDWRKVPGNAIKRAVKDSVVPPNNPFRLTPEQIAAHAAEIKANAARAQELAQEVIG